MGSWEGREFTPAKTGSLYASSSQILLLHRCRWCLAELTVCQITELSQCKNTHWFLLCCFGFFLHSSFFCCSAEAGSRTIEIYVLGFEGEKQDLTFQQQLDLKSALPNRTFTARLQRVAARSSPYSSVLPERGRPYSTPGPWCPPSGKRRENEHTNGRNVWKRD